MYNTHNKYHEYMEFLSDEYKRLISDYILFVTIMPYFTP